VKTERWRFVRWSPRTGQTDVFVFDLPKNARNNMYKDEEEASEMWARLAGQHLVLEIASGRRE